MCSEGEMAQEKAHYYYFEDGGLCEDGGLEVFKWPWKKGNL